MSAVPTSASTSNFLSDITNSSVIVKLNNGFEYHGVLSSIDGFMNIVLENSIEMVGSKEIRKYNELFVRGNNVMYIASQ
ncbi:DEKNAAC103943 [Brettanomyces naardenensis]|uniref:DEKNAAC103943 n=1 Tax=Brettanomyces naardenensis TaxID=13370 RepID=A0A448YPQ4_BRENA|nr:DEKNAAC103943 [Brettanomyces naardenensis]